MEYKVVKHKKGWCCTFEYKGEHYFADKSWIAGVGMETMIFPCDENGKVTSWGEVYCNRGMQSLPWCIRDFKNQWA